MYNDDEKPSEQISSLVKRYETMLAKSESYFFDLEEFLDIISYYTDNYQYNKALPVVEAAVKQYPFSTEILILKANVLFRKENFKEALHILNKIEPMESQNPEFHFLKGNILMVKGAKNAAIESYHKALEAADEDEETFLFSIANFLMSKDFYKEALIFLEDLIEQDYDDPDLYSDVAECYEKLGEYNKSAEYIKLILDDSPFDDMLWDYLGNMYLKAGKKELAIEAYYFAFAISDNAFDAINHLIELYLEEDKYPDALKLYEYLKTKGVESTNYHLKIANNFLEKNDLEKAKEYFQEYLKIEPKSSDAFYGIAQVEFRKMNYRKALDMLDVAILYNDSKPEYFNLKGKIYLKVKQNNKALESFEKACNITDESKLFKDYLDLLIEMQFKELLELLSNILGVNQKETKKVLVDFFIQNDIQSNKSIKQLDINELVKTLIENIISKENNDDEKISDQM